ncbi:MAG: hypothetical protein CL904_06405 [Dehalococcoidia bacterium]|nr:hypothetical protein [Dehalococcoidia bacterium]
MAVGSGATVGATSVAATSSSPSHSTSTEADPPPQPTIANEIVKIMIVDINLKMRCYPFQIP